MFQGLIFYIMSAGLYLFQSAVGWSFSDAKWIGTGLSVWQIIIAVILLFFGGLCCICSVVCFWTNSIWLYPMSLRYLVSGCLDICHCTLCMPGTCGGQKKHPIHWNQNHYMGAWNQIWVLCKSASDLNHWVISLALSFFLNLKTQSSSHRLWCLSTSVILFSL